MGLDRLAHGDQAGVVRGAPDVVALQRHGRREHDVGVAGHRRPERVVDHDRVRGARGRGEDAGEILVVVEGIPAAPVDEPDVGVVEPLAVEVEGLARPEQHVGEAGERDGGAHRVRALGQGRRMAPERRPADVAQRAVAETEAAAGEPDLAQHRRERHRPSRGPARRARRAGATSSTLMSVRFAGHPPRQRPDRRGRDPGEPLRPLGRLGRRRPRAAEVTPRSDRIPRSSARGTRGRSAARRPGRGRGRASARRRCPARPAATRPRGTRAGRRAAG